MDKKKRNKSSKIVPSDDSESVQGVSNPAYEMMDKAMANNISASGKFRDIVAEKANALQVITNVRQLASKWSNYVAKRRIRKQNNPNETVVDGVHKKVRSMLGEDESEKPKMGGIGLDDIHNDFVNTGSETLRNTGKAGKEQEMTIASNRALIQYFAKLGQSAEDETLNLDFVDTLLKSGADINCCDKHGQTILHEVARAWHTDVAKFLLEHGANINQPDKFGRTPLHVAAAVDYPQMVTLLIEKKANREARTFEEEQTPIHYAAKNDAANSLKALVKSGCLYKEVKDYKGRTPIHVAAELDRSETARILLDLQAPVGVSDNKGQKAITWMITKMAPVASEALHQFRTTDRPNRKQYYYLNLLVQDRELDPNGQTQTPLQVAVNYKQYDLLMMQVFRKLITVMWYKFGRRGAWINLLLNFVYICLWTAIGILVEYDERHKYIWPDQWWRIVLLLTAIGFTVWQIFEEVRDFFRSRKAHRNWVKWRTKEIEQDMEYCHPRWPEERKFLESERKCLEDLSPKYFNDSWNIFDWLCYFLLLVSIATHFADIAAHSDLMARWHIRVMCVTIIFLWLRLMKNARAFSLLGPFIVMLGKMIGDLIRFAFLYLEFYIPYACAFWMIFGGDKRMEGSTDTVVVDGFATPQDMLFTLFRLTLVDEYDYPGMKSVDSLMAGLLVATWLGLSAVMCINLLIALLSDTFQRVYDNAQANAVMQKAITIVSIWEGMSKKRRQKFLTYIQTECAPQSDYYDDDLTQAGDEDLKKVTLQIKDQLDEIQDAWKMKFGGFEGSSLLEESGIVQANATGVVTNEKLDHELKGLRQNLSDLKRRQDDFSDRFRKDMKTVKVLLQALVNQDGGTGFGGGGLGSFMDFESSERALPEDDTGGDSRTGESRTSVKKLKKRKKSKSHLLEPVQDDDPIQYPFSPHAEISTVRFPDPDPTEEDA